MSKKRLFITGIPTAGKSYLAKKLAEEVGGVHVAIDDFREEFSKDPQFAKWAAFYLNQNERQYYAVKDYEAQWKNLVRQSEGLWPGILEKIRAHDDESKPVIFEGVNILPHLAHKDLAGIPGIVIIGTSFEETLQRNTQSPRWGQTRELQEMEADAFFSGERPRYQSEAQKFGYQVFKTAQEAWKTALDILQGYKN